jgi:hypothetical protein
MLPSYLFELDESPPSYLSPDSQSTGSLVVELEDGGFALSDPTQTISGWDWSCTYTPASGTISLTNQDTAATSVILTGIMNLVSLSFAFDANMRPAIGYTNAAGESYFYYYNSSTEDYSTMTLPAGSTNPRLCHDDKRYQMVLLNITDVLVFYTRLDKVYCRVQREAYLIEHEVATVTPGTVVNKVGMTTGLKLRIGLSDGLFVSSP